MGLLIKNLGTSWSKLIGYVPQNIYLIDGSLSVKQVVEMGLINKKLLMFSNKKNNEIVPESYNSYLGEQGVRLSGGQRQRIAIARAMLKNPSILLLDEAFSAVDIGAEEDVMKIINDIKQDGKTILIATHDINKVEEKFDEVLCLNRHCCAFGDPAVGLN